MAREVLSGLCLCLKLFLLLLFDLELVANGRRGMVRMAYMQ